jgi:hypothetical protein
MSLCFLNRLGLLGLLALAVAAPAAAEWRDIPYADIAKMPLTLKKVDPQKIFTTTLRAKPGAGQASLPADFKLQVRVGGQVIPVLVQPDGRVELPVRQDWADAGALVQSNQPKGRIKVDVSIDSRTPPGTRMSYAQLSESVPVMERGIKEMAGMMSFMAPKVRELVLRFDKASQQTVTLTLPGGKKMLWKSDAQGHAKLPWEPKWLAATVELSAPLQGIDQVLK